MQKKLYSQQLAAAQRRSSEVCDLTTLHSIECAYVFALSHPMSSSMRRSHRRYAGRQFMQQQLRVVVGLRPQQESPLQASLQLLKALAGICHPHLSHARLNCLPAAGSLSRQPVIARYKISVLYNIGSKSLLIDNPATSR